MDFYPHNELTPELQYRLAALTQRLIAMLHVRRSHDGLFRFELFYERTEIAVSALTFEEAIDRLEEITAGIEAPPLPDSLVASVWIGDKPTPMLQNWFELRCGDNSEFALMELVAVPDWTWKIYARSYQS